MKRRLSKSHRNNPDSTTVSISARVKDFLIGRFIFKRSKKALSIKLKNGESKVIVLNEYVIIARRLDDKLRFAVISHEGQIIAMGEV